MIAWTQNTFPPWDQAQYRSYGHQSRSWSNHPHHDITTVRWCGGGGSGESGRISGASCSAPDQTSCSPPPQSCLVLYSVSNILGSVWNSRNMTKGNHLFYRRCSQLYIDAWNKEGYLWTLFGKSRVSDQWQHRIIYSCWEEMIPWKWHQLSVFVFFNLSIIYYHLILTRQG